MEITVFAKKRNTKEGKTFYTYLSNIPKKDGTKQTVSVKFREECGTPEPKNCPCNIIVEKKNVNMSKEDFAYPETGEVGTSFTMWVSAWINGSEYVDHSMDEYDI